LIDKLDLSKETLKKSKPHDVQISKDPIYDMYKKSGAFRDDQETEETNEFSRMNTRTFIDEERKRKMRIHSEILKNKKDNAIKSKLYHKIKRKKKEREEVKQFEANKHDEDYLEKLKMKAEDERIRERFELSHSSKKKGLFLSNKLKTHSSSANFLKEQISDMNLKSTEIKNNPKL